MSRALLVAAVALTMLVAAHASCPNQCSGHGVCGTNDLCTCYTQSGTVWGNRAGWTGADCSMRTCPTGLAFDRISTQEARVFSFKYTPSALHTNNSASYDTKPTERLHVDINYNDADDHATRMNHGTFSDATDREFMLRVTRVDTSLTPPEYRFEWKYAGDVIWEPEMQMSSSLRTAQDLGQADADSGIRVWWSDRATAKEGDLYEFTATHNEGVDFYDRDDNTAHQYQECSSRGACDRKSGECVCDVGYGGEACARTLCPNDCSGHGVCQSESRFAVDAGVTYTGWDAEKSMGCRCDGGFRGNDCSLRECPSGVDPLGADGGAEGRDCSGRGVCDYSSGICGCFRGYFGERCEYQTNFV